MSDPITQPADPHPDPTHQLGANNPPPFRVELAERNALLKARVDSALGLAKAMPAVIETQEQHEAAVAFAGTATTLLADITTTHTKEKAPLKEKTDAIDEFFLSKGLKGLLEPEKARISRLNGAYQDQLAQARQKELDDAAEAARQAAAAKVEEAATLEAAGRHTEASVQMEGAQAQEDHAAVLSSQAAAPVKDLGRSYTSFGTSSLVVAAKPVIDPDKIDLEKLRPFLAMDALERAVNGLIKARGFKPPQLLAGELKVEGLTFERDAKSR